MRISNKQDNRPCFSFFPKDWLSSKEIRISSLAARGLWIEILCLMFFEKKRGSLSLPAKYKTDTKCYTKGDTKNYTKYLSELTGKKEEEIRPLLEELQINEVFSYKDDLMICRRMYYENELSLTRREAVEKRWRNSDTKKDTKKIQTVGEEEVLVNKKEVNKKEVIMFNFENRKWEGVVKEDFVGWQETFPACDIKMELLRMAEWLLSNPAKKKKNYRRFINNWLSRSQDKGGTKGFNGLPPPERKSETPEQMSARKKREAEESEAQYQKGLAKWRGMSLEELRKHQVNLRKWGKIAKIPPVEVERDLAKIIKEKENNE